MRTDHRQARREASSRSAHRRPADRGTITLHYFADVHAADSFAKPYASTRRQALRIPQTAEGLAGLLNTIISAHGTEARAKRLAEIEGR